MSLFSQVDPSDKCTDPQQEIAELRRINEKLAADNESLRSQYDEAISLVSQMEPLHAHNKQLTHDLRVAKTERDDMERRLQISIQKIEELKAASERVSVRKAETLVRRDDHNWKEEAEKRQAENESLTKENIELKKAIRKEQEATQTKSDELAKILTSARSYFKSGIPSSEHLLQLLDAPRPAEPRPKKEEPNPDAELLAELRRMKKALKKERQARMIVEAKYDAARKEVQKLMDDSQKAVDTFNEKMEELRSTSESREAGDKQKIAQQEAQIKALGESLEKHQILLKEAEQKEPIVIKDDSLKGELRGMVKKNEEMEQKLSEATSNVTLLKRQNAQLVEQIKDFDSTKQKLAEKVEAANKRTEDAEKKLCEAQSAHAEVTREKEELQEMYDTALSQVQAANLAVKQSKAASNEMNNEVQEMKNAVNLLRESYETQKREIGSMYAERERLILLINKQNTLLKVAEDYSHFLNTKNKALKKEQKKFLQEQQDKPVPVEEIPLTCWLCPEFPADLARIIEDLAKNTIAPSAKVRHGFLAVARYYNSKLDAMTKSVDQANELSAKCMKVGESLTTEVAGALDIDNMTFSAVMSDPTQVSELVQRICKVKGEINSANNKSLQLNGDLKLLLDDVNAQSVAEADESIRKLLDENAAFREELAELGSRIKKAQQGAKKTISFFEDQIKDLNETVDGKDSEIARLQKIQSSLEKSLHDSEQRIEALQNELKESADNHARLFEERDSLHKAALKDLSDSFEEAKKGLHDEVDELTATIQERDNTVSKLEREIQQWKRTSELLTSAKRDKEREIEEIKAQAEEDHRILLEKLNREKEQIREQGDRSIASLKKRNKDLQELIQKTVDASNEAEERNKAITSRNTHLTMEKEQLSSRLDSLKEEMERQRQLHAARIKAVSLSTETTCQNAIDEVKSQCELEKRKIYALAASHFKQFYDARRELSGKEYTALLQTVAAELNRLAVQDVNIRRLLGLASGESPEEAISSLVMSLYHH